MDALPHGFSAPSSARRTYDHRLREAICDAGDPALLDSCVAIPRSTARSWLRRGRPRVVSLDEGDFEVAELRVQIAILKRRIDKYSKAMRKLTAVARLWRTELGALGVSLEKARVPEASAKKRLIDAVARARATLALVIILQVLKLSSARYHAWLRAQKDCGLDDRTSCPKTSPSQLTAGELQAMKEMATSEEYRHMPVTTLAMFAQRIGRVFASASTWSEKIRERKWRRPRKRLYPAKPKVGVRATEPNEYWHIDVTVIRLLDGSKVYLHGLIDNFSRRILAWRLCDVLSPMTTAALLQEAAQSIGVTPNLVADSGLENVNAEVDALIDSGLITRILALVEVSYSNSIVEAYWRSLKHQWLYLCELSSAAAVRKLVAFHVEQHNAVMPHSALRGQTPDEVYFGTGGSVLDKLTEARSLARKARLTANRALSCASCEPKAE